MRLYLARHAETTWNLAGRYQGRRESALSSLGMQQAERLAAAMYAIRPPIARVVASPMLRTVATAKLAADRLGVTVETDDRLIEIAHGTWEGRLRDELAASDPQRYHAWRNDPASVAFDGGESLAAVLERWRAFRAAVQIDVPTLAVTHDAVLRCALIDLRGDALDAFWTYPVENAAYAIVEIEGPSWMLVSAAETAHLAAARADAASQAL